MAFQLDNGVPISSYYRPEGANPAQEGEEDKDEDLLYLLNYLEQMPSYEDVRDLNKTKFKL